MINRAPDSTCPHCDYPNDANTGINTEDKPQPGDFSICWGCGSVGVFTSENKVREPDEFEKVDISKDEFIQKYVKQVKDRIAQWRMKHTN